ncbi:MAG TPA: cytidine deaminase [Candidatus Saccharimonadales bacterium]|jgi:cytidine deaminase|nr:cytidine deaminase [Candidatus Saccharimonadales bacterium]
MLIGAELEKDLLAQATSAATNAYCPYSNFPVGAAVISTDGRIFTGCNVENRSFVSGLCAERVAIAKAVTSGSKELGAVAVHCIKGNPSDPDTLMPCGACRQVMREFMDEDAAVLIEGVGKFALSELLPRAFHL